MVRSVPAPDKRAGSSLHPAATPRCRILLLPGNPFVYGAYDDFVDLLRTKFPNTDVDVVRYNLRENCENGKSAVSNSPDPSQIERELVKRVEELLREEKHEGLTSDATRRRTFLICHSFGAFHGSRLHERFPDAIEKTVFIGPFLMKPRHMSAERTLVTFGNPLVRALSLFLVFRIMLPILTLCLSDKAFKWLTSIKKHDISHAMAEEVLSVVAWEREVIRKVERFQDRYELLGDASDLARDEVPGAASVRLNPKKLILYEANDDEWCHPGIGEALREAGAQVRALDVAHGFVVIPADCECVSAALGKDLGLT